MGDSSMGQRATTAQALHDAADRAAYRGDHQTADALRLLEGNARGGEVMRRWMYEHLTATEAEIRAQARRLGLGWGASEDALYDEAMTVLRDA